MSEADPVALSALQHWVYCPRQCGLIHLDQAFADNLHTARGQAVHRPDGTVYPVEFKHGAKRQKLHDDIQLATQAICLEEMLGRWSIARPDMVTAGIARPIGRGRKHFPNCPTSLPVWKSFVGARKRFAGVPFQATARFFFSVVRSGARQRAPRRHR